MRRLVSLVVSAAVALSAAITWAETLPSARPEQVGLSSERLDRVGQILRSEIEKGKLPGAVALVARKGRIAYFESFGLLDPATGTPMTREAIFPNVLSLPQGFLMLSGKQTVWTRGPGEVARRDGRALRIVAGQPR